jgi:uncharacterized protein
MLLWLVPLGVAAGVLTTVAGLGGGMMLQLSISLLDSPAVALASTAPALLLGNLHRASLFREHVDGRVALAFAIGALPGSLCGGLLAAFLPEAILRWAMLLMTAAAITRALGWWSWTPPAGALVPAGFLIGGLAATTGGAGMLAGPLLLACGLRGDRYVATGAMCSVSLHIGRLSAYGIAGLMHGRVLLFAAILAVTILCGNALGKRLRKRIGERGGMHLELTTMIVCVALAVSGVAR